ncbi:hypothetical protein QGN29_01650 [Temperatibacter marinus]|uniref:Uncharacterized protein n=1 Tax=Temperatibacter marinus TaxID=1456591 RepID=A0AA52HAX5_9PROT|nr:hypothetical protein [Temperatibacter marinus]WND03068.1 hypothetical protein QGN29_01650 [Temperatibacter marinus]
MNEPSGIVDNAAAMPYIYGAYAVVAFLLIGMGVYIYSRFKRSEKEADSLNPRNRKKDASKS